MNQLDSAAEAVAPRRRGVGRRSSARIAETIWTLIRGREAAVALTFVLGLAVLVRVWRIDAVGYNSDEAVYAGQGAAIAADPTLKPFFPIFRAHPLLFQTFLSIGYHLGIGEVFGRLAAAAVGVLTVLLVYRTGVLLFGRRAGIYGALVLALMPYHVLVTRQVLLDGPMTLFATLVLYVVVRFGLSRRPGWLYAAGAAMGLTFLAKEPGILLLGALYAFFALSPELRIRARDLALSLAAMVIVIAPYPLSLSLSGGTSTGRSYLVWQLFRRPNHTLAFYPVTVTQAVGVIVVITAAAGLWLARGRWSWRERLLLSWILVPATFFELWPVKGFQYLLPIAPPLAILVGRTLTLIPAWLASVRLEERRARVLGAAAVGVVAASLAVPTWTAISPATGSTFLAGTGGVPGGHEAGRWIDQHVPVGAVLMTIGPSMANIVQFYGHRKAYGLSVSPNPLHRNPSYEPVENPDLQIRHNNLQYLVWDAFSADRTPFFSRKLMRYADRYNGRVVHVESVAAKDGSGGPTTPVIVIYEVRP